MKQKARVTNAQSVRQVAAYLPDNYRVVDAEVEMVKALGSDRTYGRWTVTIEGEDVFGWTLHDYVIPRLRSGLLVCEKVAA